MSETSYKNVKKYDLCYLFPTLHFKQFYYNWKLITTILYAIHSILGRGFPGILTLRYQAEMSTCLLITLKLSANVSTKPTFQYYSTAKHLKTCC